MSRLQVGKYSTSELPSGWKSRGTYHLKIWPVHHSDVSTSGWKSFNIGTSIRMENSRNLSVENLTMELLLATGFQCWDLRMEKFWYQNFHLDGKLQLCLRDIQARAHSFLLTGTTAIQLHTLELFFQCRDEMFHVTIFSGDLPVEISDSGTVNGGIVLILGLHDGIVWTL